MATAKNKLMNILPWKKNRSSTKDSEDEDRPAGDLGRKETFLGFGDESGRVVSLDIRDAIDGIWSAITTDLQVPSPGQGRLLRNKAEMVVIILVFSPLLLLYLNIRLLRIITVSPAVCLFIFCCYWRGLSFFPFFFLFLFFLYYAFCLSTFAIALTSFCRSGQIALAASGVALRVAPSRQTRGRVARRRSVSLRQRSQRPTLSMGDKGDCNNSASEQRRRPSPPPKRKLDVSGLLDGRNPPEGRRKARRGRSHVRRRRLPLRSVEEGRRVGGRGLLCGSGRPD